MYEALKKNNTIGAVVSGVPNNTGFLLNVRARRLPTNGLALYSKLLVLVGIWPTEKSRERKLFMITGLILFHLFWALITTKVTLTYVFYKTSVLDVHAFIIIEYILCFILWWTVFLKRYHIFTSIQRLASSCASIGLAPKLWIHAAFIILNITCFCLSTFNRVEDHDSKLSKLATFMEETPQLGRALDNVTDVASPIILHGLPFSVALLYIACCLQARLLITKSLKISEENHSIDMRSFETCSFVVRALEDDMSLAVFVFIVRSLIEFICTLTAVINYLVGIYPKIFVAFFLQIGTLYCLIVFGADSIQNSHSDLKKHLLKEIARKMRDERDRNLVLFLEVKEEDVTLTAWKMFYLDRRLVLSTVASLVTYGIILYQLI